VRGYRYDLQQFLRWFSQAKGSSSRLEKLAILDLWFRQSGVGSSAIFAIEQVDDRENYGEERFTIIGMVENRLLFVAYTMRGENIRIISARGAEPHERRSYHEENTWNQTWLEAFRRNDGRATPRRRTCWPW
jgi:uncharacterized DUF497 family protein